MILVITGNGKGKTTSALGTVMRAAGWGKRVAIVFFDKGGDYYGERKALDSFKGKIDVYNFGLKRFDEKTNKFRFKNTEADKAEAKKGIEKILTLYKKNKDYFLIICDELITCLNCGLADDESVRNLVTECPKDTHLLLTGRSAPDWLIEKADLVSDIKEVKHYFKGKNISAIKGLDY
jgi:cob(I)alamin adenosyltransferase